MLVQVNHKNGTSYVLPVDQVVVMHDDGTPIAVAYTGGGAVVHANAADADWMSVVAQLGLVNAKPASIVKP